MKIVLSEEEAYQCLYALEYWAWSTAGQTFGEDLTNMEDYEIWDTALKLRKKLNFIGKCVGDPILKGHRNKL